MSEKDKTKEFLKRNPPLDEEGLARQKAGQQATKTKFVAEAAEIEKNFAKFNEILDPLEYMVGGKKLQVALVCRPSMRELKNMVPKELAKYEGKKIPKNLEPKYEKFMYDTMAKMITVPKKTANEWEEYANPWFMRLFWTYIKNISTIVEGEADHFLPQS